MKILDTVLVDIFTFFECLAKIIKNRIFESLTSGSDYLLKDVTYVTWHNK